MTGWQDDAACRGMGAETSYGMYGGMSPSERRAHLRQRGGVDDVEHNRRRRVNRAANKTTTPAALALAEAMR